MADEREWVPVEVLWDARLRRSERFFDDSWDFADADSEAEPWPMIQDDYRVPSPLTKRKRKKGRGDER